MPARPFRLALAVVAFATLAGGGWLWLSRATGPKIPLGGEATLTTVAGGADRGVADGTGSQARFSDPFAVAIDGHGVLYVADAGEAGRIRKIEPDGRTTSLPGTFDTPSAIALDRAGNLYVAETGANRIRRIGRDGAASTLAGDRTAGYRDGPAAQAQFNGPVGLAVDKAGNVYVADSYNDRIRLITVDGQVKTLAGAAPGFTDGQGAAAAFNTPCGLALDSAGALLIADTGNDAIRRMDKAGVVTTLARRTVDPPFAALREPVGLTVATDGSIYVASYSRGRILQLPVGGGLRILTGFNASVAENRGLLLSHPAGLALDRKGALYIADAGAYAVRKLSPRKRGEAAAPALEPPPPPLLRAARVPWPLSPQGDWHEVVGDMGEDRGGASGDSRDHLHAGLDIRADVGQTVLATADGVVGDPLAAWSPGSLSEGLQIDQLTYIHMRVGRTPAGAPLDPARFQLLRDPVGKVALVRVKRGTRFHVGDALGTVNGEAHVHLELGARGGDFNPVALKFPGFADHFAPRISSVQLRDASGRRLTERQNGRLLVAHDAGPLSLVVDAWDQVDGDSPGRRLGLYRLGYQLLKADGSPIKGFEQPLITLEFDRLPADREAAKIAYAPESGETAHGANETRFLYVVSNRVRRGQAAIGGWRPAELPPGDYIVRIYAADYAGNAAPDGRDLLITVR